LGAFYTPRDIADRLVAIALDGIDGTPVVCDPACGDGVFLLAVADALAERGIARDRIARDLLWGFDVDPDAVAATRRAISAWSGGLSQDAHVTVADGLDDLGHAGCFDVVVGNPPFLNQLERATVRTQATRWPVGPYTDTAGLFLLAALDLVRVGGRVVLIQPQSFVAARDAAPVRNAVASEGAIVGMWTCEEFVFDADVRVCAPVLVRGRSRRREVARWTGRGVEAAAPAPTPGGTTWSGLLVRRHEPPPGPLATEGRLGDIASATAGFRDQFYGLAPFVVDVADADDTAFPRLVTCGVIDPLHCAWGERPVRFAGSRWTHPRVDLDAMDDGPLRRWVVDRVVPKVLLATQTRVLEAVVDERGVLVPSTPVIAVHTGRLYDVAAVLLAPPVTAWASREYAGVALASDALKLSARQVLEIPLPADTDAWARAATALRDGDLRGAAATMADAYGSNAEVVAWWTNRWQPR
jgi:hypothetical protein